MILVQSISNTHHHELNIINSGLCNRQMDYYGAKHISAMTIV